MWLMVELTDMTFMHLKQFSVWSKGGVEVNLEWNGYRPIEEINSGKPINKVFGRWSFSSLHYPAVTRLNQRELDSITSFLHFANLKIL